jgi:prepilin-type N-terminal cleavage/methylation domain-containing protein
MQNQKRKNSGFSLLEMTISMALGSLVLATTLQLYTQALKATWFTSERAEMQQDFRASSNLLARDISMAGAGALGQQGLSSKSVALPYPSGTAAVYPCSATTCNYINGAPVAYPTQSGTHYLYSIIPGSNLGITVNGQTSDIISIAYTDATLALNCYSVTYNSATLITFTAPPAGTVPATCILPANVTVPQPLNDPVFGLQVGDMILFSTTSGPAAVGVVTGTPTVGSTACGVTTCTTYAFPFASGDPGHVNQPTIAGGSLLALSGQSLQPAVRLLLITYYLDISPVDGVTPRLMRIQNGKLPAPVAENVSLLKFTYDAYNGGTVVTGQSALPAGTTPAMITKVNISHMVIRSQVAGIAGYQGLDLQTSVAARNLTFLQEYPISGSSW